MTRTLRGRVLLQAGKVTEPYMTAVLSEVTRLLELISRANHTGGTVAVLLTQSVGFAYNECLQSGKIMKTLSEQP